MSGRRRSQRSGDLRRTLRQFYDGELPWEDLHPGARAAVIKDYLRDRDAFWDLAPETAEAVREAVRQAAAEVGMTEYDSTKRSERRQGVR